MIDEEWLSVVFKMLRKNGDLHNPSNRLPTATLSTFYKVVDKIIADRIHLLLDSEQSDDWRHTIQRMNERIHRGIKLIHLILWSYYIRTRQWSFVQHIANGGCYVYLLGNHKIRRTNKRSGYFAFADGLQLSGILSFVMDV